MLLEWLRRHDAEFATHLQTYLFTTGPIREVSQGSAAGGAASGGSGELAIGSMRRPRD